MSFKRMQRSITRWLEDWFGQDPRRADRDSFAEAGLDDVVQVLESIEHPRLSSDARDRIWQAALERAGTVPAPAEERRRPARERATWQPRRVALRPALVAVFLAIAMCFSSFGVTLAAQETYPNDTLYPVKRLSEDVWFSLASESARPQVAMELLIRRVDEVEHLARRQEPIPAEILDEVDTHLRWIEQAERSTWEEDTLERLDYHIRALEDLAAEYPDNAQLSLALTTCQRAYQTASGQPYTPDDTSIIEEMPAGSQIEPTVPPTPTPRPTRQFDPPQWDGDDPPVGIEESPQDNPTPQPDELDNEGENTTDEDGGATTPTDQPPTEEPPPTEVPPTEVPPDDDHVPPGQELTPPGQELTPPGQEDKENTPPGQELTPPGQERTPPGQDKK
jgi:hypothetical protein